LNKKQLLSQRSLTIYSLKLTSSPNQMDINIEEEEKGLNVEINDQKEGENESEDKLDERSFFFS
jgi:hypothetical protein